MNKHRPSLREPCVNTGARLLGPLSYPEWGEHSDSAGPAVLDECAGDDLQGLGHGAVGPLLHPCEGPWALHQLVGHGHLHGAAARQQVGFQEHVPAHLHGVLQVPLHLLTKGDTNISQSVMLDMNTFDINCRYLPCIMSDLYGGREYWIMESPALVSTWSKPSGLDFGQIIKNKTDIL